MAERPRIIPIEGAHYHTGHIQYALRKFHGLAVSQLALTVGYNSDYISQFELNNKKPGATYVIDIASSFGIHPIEFITLQRRALDFLLSTRAVEHPQQTNFGHSRELVDDVNILLREQYKPFELMQRRRITRVTG